MPRHIRNFWLTAQIDGRRSPFASGPRSKCGGFSLEVFCRDRGTIGHPLHITGRCVDGCLVLDIDDNGTPVFRKTTER
jgi:hypothetical protein